MTRASQARRAKRGTRPNGRREVLELTRQDAMVSVALSQLLGIPEGLPLWRFMAGVTNDLINKEVLEQQRAAKAAQEDQDVKDALDITIKVANPESWSVGQRYTDTDGVEGTVSEVGPDYLIISRDLVRDPPAEASDPAESPSADTGPGSDPLD